MPAAIAPAPSAPPVSAPIQTPVSSGASGGDAFDQQFNDLEDAPPEVKPEPKPEAKPETVKPEAKAGIKKPEAKPEPDKPVVDDKAPTTGSNSDFRKWGLRQQEKADRFSAELTTLKGELAQLKTAKPETNGKAMAEVLEQLAKANKRNEDYENEMRLTNYERSAHYKKEYQVPYEGAIKRAYREVKELLVSEPTGQKDENEQPVMRDRAATPADFDELYSLPLGQASRLAKAKFGDSAFIVLQHRQQIRQLAEASVAAIEEHKTKGAEHEKEMSARQTQETEAMAGMFQKVNEDLRTKFSTLFGERPDDAKWNELLTKGRQTADLAFSDRAGLSPQQKVILDAQIYNRAASFPALKYEVGKLKAELEAANQTITELKSSGPGKPAIGGDAPTTRKTADELLNELPE